MHAWKEEVRKDFDIEILFIYPRFLLQRRRADEEFKRSQEIRLFM
jgi:hypothetical protein